MTKQLERTKLTPPMLAKQWGVSPEKIIAFIRAGLLRAIDSTPPGSRRPRFLIDVADIAAFEQARAVNAPPAARPTRRRKKAEGVIQFY